MNPPPFSQISYKQIKKENPSLARTLLVDFFNKGNSVTNTAKFYNCSRTTIYNAINRHKNNELKDKSRKPHSSSNKISDELENKIVDIRKRYYFGAVRIMIELRKKGIKVHHNTITKVFKRNNLKKRKRKKSMNNELRDYYKAPFYFIEIDTKEILDQHTLPKDIYEHFLKYKLPQYQYTAIDTFTRLRWLSFAYENTFTNGMAFLYYVLYSLRSSGIESHIIFQSDNGQEFGGYTNKKLKGINDKLNLLNATLIHIPKGKKHLQGHVERSHRTDDEELYLSEHILDIKNKYDFIKIATQWLFYYNVLRPSQDKYLGYKSPFNYAITVIKNNNLDCNTNINKLGHSHPILIDNVAVDITYFLNKLFLDSVQYVRGNYLIHK